MKITQRRLLGGNARHAPPNVRMRISPPSTHSAVQRERRCVPPLRKCRRQARRPAADRPLRRPGASQDRPPDRRKRPAAPRPPAHLRRIRRTLTGMASLQRRAVFDRTASRLRRSGRATAAERGPARGGRRAPRSVTSAPASAPNGKACKAASAAARPVWRSAAARSSQRRSASTAALASMSVCHSGRSCQ